MANIYGVQFDRVNDYFDLGDNAAYDFTCDGTQDAFYAFWIKVNDFSGNRFQYFFSNNGTPSAAGSFNLVVDNSGDVISVIGSAPISSNSLLDPTGYVYVVVQYNKNRDRFSITTCTEGGTSVSAEAFSLRTDNVFGSAWNLGRRADGNAARHYGGLVYNMAKGNQLLSNSEIETLASDFLNYDPTDNAIFTPQIYFPMNEGTGNTITDTQLGLTGTGVGFPTNSHWVLEGTTSGGGQTVSLNPIVSTVTFNNTTVLKDLAISLDTIASTASVDNPTVLKDLAISLDTIASTESVDNPTVLKDLLISLNTIDSTLTASNPTVLKDLAISLDTIDSTASVANPQILLDKIINLTTITSEVNVLSPEVLKDQKIALDKILSTTTVYSPNLLQDKVIRLAKVQNTINVYAPTLSGSSVTIPDNLIFRMQLQWHGINRL